MARHARVIFLGIIALGILGCADSTEPRDDRDPRILWVFQADAGIYYGSAALSADEQVVYFGTSEALFAPTETDHALYALSVATGALRWRFPLATKQVRSTPAVAADGSIAFLAQELGASGGSSPGDILYRLSSDGGELWNYNVNPVPRGMEVGQSAPAIAPDGTIYVAGDALYAIRPDGRLKWKQFGPASEDLRNSPVVAPDGTVYFVFHNIPLTALAPEDGRVLWSCPLGVNDHVFASPAIGPDGTVYVATNPGIVYAVSAAGQVLWTFDASTIGYQCTMRSSPAVDADGTIYFGTNSGNPASVLFALNPNGSVKWKFEPSDLPPDVAPTNLDIYSSPAIGSDGMIYFGQEFGRVYALEPTEGTFHWVVGTTEGITWPSPALAQDGTLLIGDLGGRFYAIRTESRGLKATAWPKFRRDSRNSGCGMSPP